MILRDIKSNIQFFADDTMVFSIIKDPKISAIELNHDLEVSGHIKWKFEFNPDPTKQTVELLISWKTSHTDHPSLPFNGTIVTQVKEPKTLGLAFESK